MSDFTCEWWIQRDLWELNQNPHGSSAEDTVMEYPEPSVLACPPGS